MLSFSASFSSYDRSGALATQQWCTEVKEHTLLMSILVMHSTLACVVQFFGIGSAGVFFISSIFIFTALVVDQCMRGKNRRPNSRRSLRAARRERASGATIDRSVPTTIRAEKGSTICPDGLHIGVGERTDGSHISGEMNWCSSIFPSLSSASLAEPIEGGSEQLLAECLTLLTPVISRSSH